jgi:prepilin-type N-terminal cleavage/methylation domain-containing protein
MESRNRAGFSLVEILVVIAILAIIAAILLPVFASAKRSSKLNSDLQSLRQLGSAVVLYCGDSDDLLPPAVTDIRYLDGVQNGWNDYNGLAKSPWVPLGEILYPYIKNKQVFLRIEDKPDLLTNWPESIPKSEFIFDELSGLRGKLLSSMPATSTLLLGGVTKGKERQVKTPCLFYSMSAKMTPYGDCEGKTAWISDI